MSNLLSNLRKLSQFNQIHILNNFLKRSIVILLTGSLLVLTVACGSNAFNTALNSDVQPDLYEAIQPEAGGMNGYNDDPRYDRPSETVIRARALTDQAKAQRSKVQASEFVDGVKENARDLRKVTQRKGEDLLDNTLDSAEKVTRDLKRAAQDVGDNLVDTLH